MNIEGTAFYHCGTLGHREELSENTRGTAGMLMSSSGVQRKQDEHRLSTTAEHTLTEKNCQRTLAERLSSSGVQRKHRRNSFLLRRNTRSQRRTVREHS